MLFWNRVSLRILWNWLLSVATHWANCPKLSNSCPSSFSFHIDSIPWTAKAAIWSSAKFKEKHKFLVSRNLWRNSVPDSLVFYLIVVRSDIFSLVPVLKYVWNFFSRWAQLAMELTGSDKSQVKAGPDRDKEKKQTRWASSTDASPNCVRYQLTCSIVLVLSWPVNLANSRSL